MENPLFQGPPWLRTGRLVHQGSTLPFGQTNKRGYGESGEREDSLGAISHIKLSQGTFRGNPRESLVPPVSLLVVSLSAAALLVGPNQGVVSRKLLKTVSTQRVRRRLAPAHTLCAACACRKSLAYSCR